MLAKGFALTKIEGVDTVCQHLLVVVIALGSAAVHPIALSTEATGTQP